MEVKKKANGNDIKCFNIISNTNDKKFGQECAKLLLKKNSVGKVAGQIKCSRCHALYDIKNDDIILIERGK